MIAPERIEKKQNLTIVYPINHKHTIMWLHGLGEHQDKYIKKMYNALGQHADNFKIILPRAPDRFVNFLGTTSNSWFNIIMRGQMRFIVPFQESFGYEEIKDSFQRILVPIIQKYSEQVKALGGKFIVAGFSQGCAMSLHCLYSKPELVDAAIGVSGYFFTITNFIPGLSNRVHLIYGQADYMSLWEHSKTTYYGRIPLQKVKFVSEMGHEVNKDTEKAIGDAINLILEIKAKL